MVKIFIDPGHGGSDPGATANGLREKDLTLEISKKIRDYLKAYKGLSVKMSRNNDRTLSLEQRTNAANKWGADYLLSVHINAGGGTGFESYIYNGSYSGKNKTNSLRNVIHNEVVKATGYRDRGKKQANFHMVRQSRMHASLTENGFIDNKSDADKLKSGAFLNKIAKGHAVGIAKAFKLKKKVKSKPNTKPSSGKHYKVQIGAFSRKDNADQLALRAKARGFDQFVVKQGNLYKVQLGAFKNKKNAESLSVKAKKSGFETYIAYE